MTGRARRLFGGTLQLLLAGPPLLLGVGFTRLAEGLGAGCRRISGDAVALPGPPVPPARTPSGEGGVDLVGYKRAARVLYADGFDTAELAELLGESEADVARWVCRPGDARVCDV